MNAPQTAPDGLWFGKDLSQPEPIPQAGIARVGCGNAGGKGTDADASTGMADIDGRRSLASHRRGPSPCPCPVDGNTAH